MGKIDWAGYLISGYLDGKGNGITHMGLVSLGEGVYGVTYLLLYDLPPSLVLFYCDDLGLEHSLCIFCLWSTYMLWMCKTRCVNTQVADGFSSILYTYCSISATK